MGCENIIENKDVSYICSKRNFTSKTKTNPTRSNYVSFVLNYPLSTYMYMYFVYICTYDSLLFNCDTFNKITIKLQK